MTLVRFQPAPFKSLLHDIWNLPTDGTANTQPVVNILETATGFRIDIAAPGLTKNDFQIKVEKNLLTVSTQKEVAPSAEGVTYHRREFAYGTFERNFRLPDTIDTDNIAANFAHGILSVNLVKKAEAQPIIKTIAVG